MGGRKSRGLGDDIQASSLRTAWVAVLTVETEIQERGGIGMWVSGLDTLYLGCLWSMLGHLLLWVLRSEVWAKGVAVGF